MSKYRIIWGYDDDPDYSYLEQWDTPEKYYDLKPTCPKCGAYMEYSDSNFFLCADEDCNHELEVFKDIQPGDSSGYIIENGEPLSFEDYMLSYGDPQRHVFLRCVVEEQCEHCNSWVTKGSVGNVDFMDTEQYFEGVTTPGVLKSEYAMNEHQLLYSVELLEEAGMSVEELIRRELVDPKTRCPHCRGHLSDGYCRACNSPEELGHC